MWLKFSKRSCATCPPPKGDPDAPLKALIFDSWYDSYRGVIVLFRVIDGTIRPGMKIRFFNAGRDYQVETLGVNRPRRRRSINLGWVKWVSSPHRSRLSPTYRSATRLPNRHGRQGTVSGLPGDQADGVRGLYPVDTAQYEELRDALDKLRLNDASFFYEPESSTALGFGFRCGFLGLAAHGDRAGAFGA